MLKSLEDNLFPAIGKRSIEELKTRDLLVPIKVVKATGRFEVASRLQQQTTAIIRYTVQSGLIDYNPAPPRKWQEQLLPVIVSIAQHFS